MPFVVIFYLLNMFTAVHSEVLNSTAVSINQSNDSKSSDDTSLVSKEAKPASPSPTVPSEAIQPAEAQPASPIVGPPKVISDSPVNPTLSAPVQTIGDTTPKAPTIASPEPAFRPPAITEALPAKRHFETTLYILESFAKALIFNNVLVTGGGYSDSANANIALENAAGFGFEVGQNGRDTWGWGIGLEYQGSRSMKSITVDTHGKSSTTYPGDPPSLTLLTVELSYRYSWRTLFLPFGTNFSFPSLKNSGANVHGGFGGQAGLGVYLNDLFSVEILEKAVSLNLDASVANINVDYGTGYMYGPQIEVRFTF